MDPYDILGVDEHASKKSITTNYRALAKKHHPDKGGDSEQFDRVTKAYKILSDDTCRKIYDNYGDEQADKYLNGVFTELNGIVHEWMAKPTGEDKIIIVYAELKDFYFGSTIIYHHSRLTWCNVCVKIIDACPSLKKGASFIQNVCSKCDDGIICIKENITIKIPPGAKNKYKSIYSEKGDSTNIKTVPGSLIIYVHQKPNNMFERNNDNLIININITLDEALCGFHREILLIDDETIWVHETKLFDFIEIKYIKKMGMPIESTNERGDLIIVYRTEFPSHSIPIKAKPLLNIILFHEKVHAISSTQVNDSKIYATTKCTGEHITQTNFDISMCRQM